METLTFPMTGEQSSPARASAAVQILRDGGVVALPTETVYGLAADALNPMACARIFEAKGRPLTDPLIVHVPDISWIARLGVTNSMVDRLAAAFWPGPLTFIIPRNQNVPDIVTAGQLTVAVRMSAHPVFAAVIGAFGGPLAAPSANRFGRISPTTADHVMQELGSRIPLVVDGGPCAHGIESTIIQIVENKIQILRSGPISSEALASYGDVQSPASSTPVTPGSMKSHYAPNTPMEVLPVAAIAEMDPDARIRCGLLLPRPNESLSSGFSSVEILSASGDPVEMAARLFAAMRRLDACRLERILAIPVAGNGIEIAIMERLCKASARE
jgi:L-threonylcarbamoyladenylate synthase